MLVYLGYLCFVFNLAGVNKASTEYRDRNQTAFNRSLLARRKTFTKPTWIRKAVINETIQQKSATRIKASMYY